MNSASPPSPIQDEPLVLGQEQTGTRGNPELEDTSLPPAGGNSKRELRIKILGERDSGKTTLVRSIFGRDSVRNEEDSHTQGCVKYAGNVRGENIIVYEESQHTTDTLLGTAHKRKSEHRPKAVARQNTETGSSTPVNSNASILSSPPAPPEYDLIILCVPMNRQIYKLNLLPLLEHTELKRGWDNVIIVLTFADSLKVKKSNQLTPSQKFGSKLGKRIKEINEILTKEGNPSPNAPDNQLKIFPATCDPDTQLLTGEKWFASLWAAIMELAPASGKFFKAILRGGNKERSVLYPYEAIHPDKLSLCSGDVVTNIQWFEEGVWALGKCEGQRGLFHPLLLQRKHPVVEEQKSKKEQKGRSDPPGYSYEYKQQRYMFKNKHEPDNDDTCTICLQLASEPVLTECCGRSFCSRCIGKIERQTCPTCTKTPEKGFKYCRDNKTRRLIEDRVIFCPHYREGCNWEGELRDRKSHILNECRFEKIDCKRKCGITLERRFQVTHDAHECPLREIVCRFCYLADRQDNTMTYQQMVTTHWKECAHWPLRCPNLCEDRYWTRGTLPSHLDKDCPKHVIPCKHKQFGCPFLARRQEMRKHEHESLQAHLKVVIDNYMQALKEIERLKSSLDTLTATIETMQKKVAVSTRGCHADP